MTPHSDSGIIDERSQHSVELTVERLTALLHAKGVTLFALVDHSGEAAKVGMKMPPTKLLIFGNPKAGTPVMLAAPSVAREVAKRWAEDYADERRRLDQDRAPATVEPATLQLLWTTDVATGNSKSLPSRVGARGFEPPTSWSRTRRANRAALRPEARKLEADET